MTQILPLEADSPRSTRSSGYLGPNVRIEPLIDQWPAWPHLLAPVQRALNLAFRYIPTLESFIESPDVHLAASRDPGMFGGPFVDLPESAIETVKAYLWQTRSACAELLRFAEEFRNFDQRLIQSATGFSLNDLRNTMPKELRGRVELVYDLNHHPKMKVLEEMFFKDDLGLRRSQSILLHTRRDDQRPFFLSTPLLNEDHSLRLEIPFDAPAIAQLCAAKTHLLEIDELAQRLGVDANSLAAFFVPEPPLNSRSVVHEGLRVRYFGHACVLLESSTTTLLIDPTFAVDKAAPYPHLTWQNLPDRIDYVLISHGHQDHLCAEALLFLCHRVKTVVVPRNNSGDVADPSLVHILRQLGYRHIIETDYLESIKTDDGDILTLPFTGEHCDLDVRGKQCYAIRIDGRRVGFFIDTDAVDIDVYTRLAEGLGDLDVLFIGMECNGAPLSWLYGPLVTANITRRIDDSRRLSGANCSQASRLVDLLRPKQAYVYAMGQETWMQHLMGLNYEPDSMQLREAADFVAYCRKSGLISEMLLGNKEITL